MDNIQFSNIKNMADDTGDKPDRLVINYIDTFPDEVKNGTFADLKTYSSNCSNILSKQTYIYNYLQGIIGGRKSRPKRKTKKSRKRRRKTNRRS